MLRKRVVLALVAALVLLGPIFATTAQADQRPARPRTDADAVRSVAGDTGTVVDWWVVEVRKGGPDPGKVADQLEQSLGISVSHVYRHGFRGFAARIPASLVEQVRAYPNVVSLEPDEPVTLDGAVHVTPEPMMAADTGQVIPSGIERVGATRNSVARIDGVEDPMDADVAVIDTGVDRQAADWDLNLQGGVNCAPNAPSADTGWDTDGYIHGTHVAGIIGARDNDHGVVGVAPGARIWSVKIFDDNGRGSTRTLLCGLDWIKNNIDGGASIDVANMSLGTSPKKKKIDDRGCGKGLGDDMHKAICDVVDAGVTLVAAAGNEKTNANRVRPAAYDEVITVSAFQVGEPIGSNDRMAAFSNYGQDVDISAPGVEILSLVPGPENLGVEWGTSFSAPHVTGGVALLIASSSASGRIAPTEIRSALIANREAVRIKGDRDKKDEGILNVANGWKPGP